MTLHNYKIVAITIALCTALSLCPEPVELGDTASNSHPWNFEIYNKSRSMIRVSVTYADLNSIIKNEQLRGVRMVMDTKTGKQVEAKGQKIRAAIDLTRKPVVTIQLDNYYRSRKKIVTCQNLPRQGDICSSPAGVSYLCKPEDMVCKKQAFLTFDGHQLRPQTGQFGGFPQIIGLAGTTDSGLKIINNIGRSELQKVDFDW